MSIDYKLNALKETWVGTIQQIADSDDIKTLIDSLIKLSEDIGFIIDKLGVFGTTGVGAGIFFGLRHKGNKSNIAILIDQPQRLLKIA